MDESKQKLTELRLFSSRLPETARFSLVFAPIIDLFFILLIFITLGAGMVYSQGIQINPPSIDTANYEYVDKLVIALKTADDGMVQIYFNDRTVHDFNMLENQLKKIVLSSEGRHLPVIMLRVDGNVTNQNFVQVMNICRKNNLKLFVTTQKR